MTITVARNMIGAELLKLRRHRPLMAFSLFLSVIVLVLFFGYNAIQHASDPLKYAPAGGTHAFDRAVRVLGLFFGSLTAVLIGSEAGTTDLSSGVFRDLVATGRSRLALFFVRAPAAIVLTLAFSAAGYLIATVATFVFAGSLPTPSAGVILQAAAWIALANALIVILAVGVGSLTGSRALTLTAVIGWQAVATPLLSNVGSLGSARDGLLSPALGALMPVSGGFNFTMATGVAVVVVIAWAAVSLVVGALRTRVRDA
jgi:hypothetical protein